MTTQSLKYTATPDAWQTKIHDLIALPFPLPWLLIAGTFFVIGYALIYFSSTSPAPGTVPTLAINCALIAAIANSVVFYENLLDEIADTFPVLLDVHTEKAEEWTSDWYHNIFWSKKNLVAGLILGLLCVWSKPRGNLSIFDLIMTGKAYSCFLSFVIGFLGGSMFWTMLGIARMASSLGGKKIIKPSIFDGKTSALRTASGMLWKVSLTAMLVYLLGMSNFFFSTWSPNIKDMILPTLSGAFIILYFVLPQINIHKTLVKTKSKRMVQLVKQLDATFDKVSADPTPENINQLRDLFHLQDAVNGKRAWAFGVGELLMLIGTALVPLIAAIIGHLVDK